jgi:hypothetical protein
LLFSCFKFISINLNPVTLKYFIFTSIKISVPKSTFHQIIVAN